MTADRLARLAARELEGEPEDLAALAPLLAALAAEPERLAALLRAKEEQLKGAWFVEAEPLWMKRLTWRLMRPLFVVALLAAVGFSLQDAFDPTLGVSAFLLGAASLYVVVQFFAHLWARRDERRLAEVRRRYRETLGRLLER